MKIYFGADHAGFDLKEELVEYLRDEGYEVIDKGAYQNVKGDDYPEYIAPVAEIVSSNPNTARGIILGGSGQGEAIVANRFSNVRAIVFNGQYQPKDGRKVPNEIVISREHNDSNILSLGARFLSIKEAKEAVKLWLETPFPGEVRHKRRISKIDDIARKKICTTVNIRTNLLGSGSKTKKPKLS
ncbi:MAG: RpiB/LacA/LacB family sugar-phosphate isomerase [Candidatus Pacebacteria bacterium]|nr:RpiB/LacA/LacB family sugar-phosphate isomerase [Candidatus Paceibacterota bacterium]